MNRKVFSLGAVLSVTTDRLFAPLGQLYEILNFMTRDNLFTHQLPRAARECKPYILRQHPEFEGLDVSGVTPENWREFLSEQEQRFGKSRLVEEVPEDDHARKDPVVELVEMVGEDRVIVVREDDPEQTP